MLLKSNQSLQAHTLSRRRFLVLAGAAGAAGALIACTGEGSPRSVVTGGDGAAPSNLANGASDLDVIFPTDRVNQIKFTISKANWQAMLDDMTTLFGARGASGGGAGGNGGLGQMPPGEMPPGGVIPGQLPDGAPQGGMPGGAMASSKKPMWVAGDVTFNGQTWKHVGIRFKGNSSLRSSWSTSSDRLPFKLDFDEREADHPEIKNQRFHGAKQLSLSNNVGDPTYMRETLAYQVLGAAGLTAARTAFYEVILDRGEGENSLGIYTAIEVVDDTLIKRVFGEDKGNIYEAEGNGTTLASSVTAAQIETSFQKENNTDAADWSDIKALHAILNSGKRTSDAAAWRHELEAVFDVPVFLEWLAVSTTLEHWDTYGGMSHNFYLYNSGGKLSWISWDHNFILGAMGGGGMPGGAGGLAAPPAGAPANNQPRPGGGGGRVASLDKKEVSSAWPLIRYLLDVPEYYAAYQGFLRQTIDGPFNAAQMSTTYASWSSLLAPYAEKQGAGAAFQTAVQTLNDRTKQRTQAVTEFLGS